MTFITVAEVRIASGAPTTLISDDDITSIIADAEADVSQWLNTKFVPTQRLEFIDGTGTERLFLLKNPVLAVRELNTNSTSISLDELYVSKQSGKIELSNGAETSVFASKRKTVKVKYLYGLLEESSTSTTSTAATTAGTSVAISVSSETNFSDNDWVEITGMDGNQEVAKITGTDTNEITVDQLVLAHESGSVVVKLLIPHYIKRYMNVEAAIAVAINAIGATYTFQASYNLGELSVVKGVPYTHWRESIEKLLKERAMRKARIRPRPSIQM
ncbi:hypothetical protein GQ473_01825 [archaeon]|nr:hypothetical protein [archaeon]